LAIFSPVELQGSAGGVEADAKDKLETQDEVLRGGGFAGLSRATVIKEED
jgi:hypothetical protein